MTIVSEGSIVDRFMTAINKHSKTDNGRIKSIILTRSEHEEWLQYLKHNSHYLFTDDRYHICNEIRFNGIYLEVEDEIQTK